VIQETGPDRRQHHMPGLATPNPEWKRKGPAVRGAARFSAIPSPFRDMGGLFPVLQNDRSIAPTRISVIFLGDSPW